jgi:hypothetical protein
MVSEVSALALIALSSTSAAGSVTVESITEFSIYLRSTAFNMAMLALSIGSIFLCYLFLVHRLIPRILTIVGLVGYVCLLANTVVGMFGVDAGMLLFIPGALFELAFPVWLFIKGFNTNFDSTTGENT